MSEIQSRHILDEDGKFYLLQGQNPRFRTLVQRQTVSLKENPMSLKDYHSAPKDALLCCTTARVFATPDAIANDIMGGDPFRSLRLFVAYKDLGEKEDEENVAVSKIFRSI